MKKIAELFEVAKVLQTELQRRFVKYTSPSISGHNAIMLTATFLDLRYRLLLNSMQRDSAKTLLAELVSIWTCLHVISWNVQFLIVHNISVCLVLICS